MPSRKSPGFQDDEPTTLITCLACGGEFEKLYEADTGYRMSVCEWCTRGSMSAAQIGRWHAHTQGRNR